MPKTVAETFLPENAPKVGAILLFYWLIPVGFVILPFAKTGITLPTVITSGILLLVFSIVMIIPLKLPISISVSTQTKQLLYHYVNGLAQHRVKTVDLLTTSGDYTYVSHYSFLPRSSYSGWRILLHSNHWYGNKLVIKENPTAGFSIDQLDKIATLIEQCKGYEI